MDTLLEQVNKAFKETNEARPANAAVVKAELKRVFIDAQYTIRDLHDSTSPAFDAVDNSMNFIIPVRNNRKYTEEVLAEVGLAEEYTELIFKKQVIADQLKDTEDLEIFAIKLDQAIKNMSSLRDI